MNGPELTLVEQPFLHQLVRMGWEHTTGSLDDPGVTDRETFRDVCYGTTCATPCTGSTWTPGASPGSTRAASPRR
jgi:hypothetical protein